MNSHNHSHEHDYTHTPDNCKHQEHIQQSSDYLQKKHQNEVKSAFTNYSKDMKLTFDNIFSPQKKLIKYFQLVRQRKRQQLNKAIQANQKFLNLIIQYSNRSKENTDYKPDEETLCHNISKIRTTIKQFFRQWCSQSPQIKDYIKLVQYCKKYLNKKDKILVPGCGLARLPLQLIQAGFHVQGNEVTYFMLYGSDFILNCADEKQKYEIYPFIHTLSNHECQQDMFRSVRIPDKVAVEVVPQDADFSMAAGQFNQIYQHSHDQFNGVVTCFFIDTANDIFQYIDTIFNILVDKGIWINYGPLLYHYKDMLDQVSIELSWEQVEAYIKYKGFILVNEQKVQTTYCHDPLSSYKHIYQVSITIWRKIIIEKQQKKQQQN